MRKSDSYNESANHLFNSYMATPAQLRERLRSLKPEQLSAFAPSLEYLNSLTDAEILDHLDTHTCESTAGETCDYCDSAPAAYRVTMNHPAGYGGGIRYRPFRSCHDRPNFD